jgi:hypothetical protein
MKLMDALEVCRLHQAKYEWKNLVRKIDIIMSDPGTTRIYCTDFGATLDLMSSEKDNSSVNNHTVICIVMVSHNWRTVPYLNGDKKEDETIICDTDRWIFFGNTYEKGKKNDHVFHDACIKYIQSFYDNERTEKGLPPIAIHIIWTDNCPTQYKCRHNFYNVATFGSNVAHHSQQVHTFGQKYRFKGPWDATGKIVKQRILNNELKNLRCANAWDCYVKLREQMTKDGTKDHISKLFEYEQNGDVNVLKNTTFTCKRTFIGYCTEDKSEYDGLVSVPEYKHIVYTDRTSAKPDMVPLDKTQMLGQVHGECCKNPETNK